MEQEKKNGSFHGMINSSYFSWFMYPNTLQRHKSHTQSRCIVGEQHISPQLFFEIQFCQTFIAILPQVEQRFFLQTRTSPKLQSERSLIASSDRFLRHSISSCLLTYFCPQDFELYRVTKSEQSAPMNAMCAVPHGIFILPGCGGSGKIRLCINIIMIIIICFLFCFWNKR